jgi:hypothetical protein
MEAFDFVAYTVFGVVIALAIGVFFYGRLLDTNKTTKDTELMKAEADIDPLTIQGFVRLRDRLTFGRRLLEDHIALSGFFSLVETLVPTTMRFVSLNLSVNEKGKVNLDVAGVAKNFNALSAASTAFANDGRIKDAIFSNIVVNPKDSSVSFELSATLDQKLVAFSTKTRPTTSPSTTTATSTQATSTAKTP